MKICNTNVPTVKNPRLLGVIFDPLFTFSNHAVSLPSCASSRLNIIRALSDTSFGKDKECLSLTYKTFIRSLFDYCAPIVYPTYSPASIERLQKVQNKALRLVTGCHTAASVDHLHEEASELPVKDHLHLLSSQFLARALQPGHVSYPFATLDQGSRKLKHTLRSKCIADVQPYLEADGSLGRGNFGPVKNKLHTDIVRKATSIRGPNRVLGSHPPPIHACEAGLPRLTRTTLAQLRSGHCGKLRDFQKRVGKTNDDICADCNLSQQNVGHLFDCPAHPTTLNVRDLWENPRDAVDHLNCHCLRDLQSALDQLTMVNINFFIFFFCSHISSPSLDALRLLGYIIGAVNLPLHINLHNIYFVPEIVMPHFDGFYLQRLEKLLCFLIGRLSWRPCMQNQTKSVQVNSF